MSVPEVERRIDQWPHQWRTIMRQISFVGNMTRMVIQRLSTFKRIVCVCVWNDVLNLASQFTYASVILIDKMIEVPMIIRY